MGERVLGLEIKVEKRSVCLGRGARKSTLRADL